MGLPHEGGVALPGEREAQGLLVGAVEAALLALERREDDLLELVGQVAQNLGLEAAQHEGGREVAQALGGVDVA